ncbi:MAG: four helix bundle protein [Patescibacteria group bacterium]|jgi:four helix bundle protein|nr:four helix bundle protein [Patescibacteria group bacterium]
MEKSHELVLEIYKITKTFPKEELFGLTSQIRRAAVSITSNIAEGFSRNSYKDKLKFYYISQGSLTELQNQLLIAKDVEYIISVVFKSLADKTVVSHKLINGLIKKSKEIYDS